MLTLIIIVLLSVICIALDFMIVGAQIKKKVEEAKAIKQKGQEDVSKKIQKGEKGNFTSKVSYTVKSGTLKMLIFLRTTFKLLRNTMAISLIVVVFALSIVAIMTVSATSAYLLLFDTATSTDATASNDGNSTSDGENNAPVGENNSNTPGEKGSHYILIGDSRTVGLYQAIGEITNGDEVLGLDKDGNYYIAKVGEGYKYMTDKADVIIDAIGEIKDVVVVINMGTNDAGGGESSGEKYAKWVNEQAEKWKEAGAKDVYFVSTNPVDTSKYTKNSGYTLTNENIEAFNEGVKSNLSDSIAYIDTYSALKDKVVSNDGIHYDADTYKEIYKTIKSSVLK